MQYVMMYKDITMPLYNFASQRFLIMSGRNSYESTKRYQDKVYETVLVRLKKGEKNTIKKHADKLDMSVNAFIRDAISEKIKRTESEENKDAVNGEND